MEDIHSVKAYHKISPTAKMVAYWRSLSDIPFSKEIADAVGAEETTTQMLGDKIFIMAHSSPLIMEARYKAIDQGLKKLPAAGVMELACGLSPRGLALAANNIKYVGTDLPGMLSESAPVISELAAEAGIPGEYLHFCPVNVLDKSALEAAADLFEDEPFNICNEGLLMYLDKEEKATMAQHIRALLPRSGGAWVTTDIMFNNLRNELLWSLPDLKKTIESTLGSISRQVERDIAGNDFESEAEAMRFYKELGFRVEQYPFYDRSYRLSTLQGLPEVMKGIFLHILSKTHAWILKPIHAS